MTCGAAPQPVWHQVSRLGPAVPARGTPNRRPSAAVHPSTWPPVPTTRATESSCAPSHGRLRVRPDGPCGLSLVGLRKAASGTGLRGSGHQEADHSPSDVGIVRPSGLQVFLPDVPLLSTTLSSFSQGAASGRHGRGGRGSGLSREGQGEALRSPVSGPLGCRRCPGLVWPRLALPIPAAAAKAAAGPAPAPAPLC